MKKAHLEMILTIIGRMSNNSFLLKGWSVTLVTGVFALMSNNCNNFFFPIAFFPVIIFWCLDSYYLKIERLYRELYKTVIEKEESEIDFSMDINLSSNTQVSFFDCFLSTSEVWFYVPLALLSAVVFFLANIR